MDDWTQMEINRHHGQMKSAFRLTKECDARVAVNRGFNAA